MENNIIKNVEEFEISLNNGMRRLYQDEIQKFIENNGTLFNSTIIKTLSYKYIIIRESKNEENPFVLISFEKLNGFYILYKKQFNELCYYSSDTLIENGTCSDKISIDSLINIIDRIKLEAKLRLLEHTKYGWAANSSDGCFEDKSKQYFDTKEEAYNDMRNAALDKMKWNTEYNEDYFNTNEYNEGTIEYNVVFSRDKITHNSYSGQYTYEIIEVVQ